jgi:branched-chain amino acid aminotransferase
MPTLIRYLTPQTILTPDYSGDSLADTQKYEPHHGVYTITNTYHTYQVLKLTEHLDRLEDSARRIGIDLTLDRVRLRATLRQMISEAQWGDVRFRISVGADQLDTLILTIEPFHPPAPKVYADGTRCITAANSARKNAEAKTTEWAFDREALQKAMPAGIYDTFLLDEHGHLLEGLASNFYAIVDGHLYTANEGVLFGISRQIVLAVAPNILPIQLQPINVSQLAQVQEAFLSSSSRGIVPVVEIDGVTMGAGVVGETTKALRGAYADWVNAHLEEL